MKIWRLWSGGLALTLVVFISCAIGLAQVDIFWPGTQPGTYTGNAIDFGAVPIGTTKTATYTFKILETSATSATVTITRPNAPFGSNAPIGSFVLAPGQSRTFNVTFMPPSVGNYTGSFTITAKGGRPAVTKRQTVTLTGTGAGDGQPPDNKDHIVEAIEDVDRRLGNLGAQLGMLTVGNPLELDLYIPLPVPTSLSELLASIEAKLDALQAELVDGEAVLPPVEVTKSSGERFRNFLFLCNQLLTETQEDLRALNPPHASTQAIVEDFSVFLLAAQPEIEQLITLSQSLPLEGQAYLDAAVVDGAPELLSTINNATSYIPKFDIAAKEKGCQVAEGILKKVADIASAIGGFFGPGAKAIFEGIALVSKDVAKLFESNASMIALLSGLYMSEYEQELKLEALIKGLLGVEIDLSKGTQAEAAALSGVQPYSLPQRFDRQEEEINELRQRTDESAKKLGKQIELLRKKLDNLARILGLSLYGKEVLPHGFDIEPPPEFSTTSEDPIEYEAIKPEIKQIETEVKVIKEKVEEILRRLGQGGGFVPTLPQDFIVQLAMTKKIYVYREGTFSSTGPDDFEEVYIKTNAFDLAGWIDLTELKKGDEVRVVIEVSVADGPFRTWSTTLFSGVQTRGLKYFTEFANGLGEVVGTDVRITITQTASADGFATQIPIYYQFIVESQN